MTTTSIRCAHCKARHESVQQVRDCANDAQRNGWHRAAEWAQDADKRRAQPVSAPPATGTPHRSIFDVKGVNPNGSPRTDENNTANPYQTPAAVRSTPWRLSNAEQVTGLKAFEDMVPAGRYAIGAEGATKFYRVDKPTAGRWNGYTFVKAQASDELHSVKHPARRLEILTEIAKDVRGALVRYGMEIGKCGVCGRTLTNPESLVYGIGPVCRGELDKMGF